jgi:hypothetical protein
MVFFAVGIAEHEHGSAGFLRGGEGAEGKLAVLSEGVEEMLGVVDDLTAFGTEKADGVGNHGEIFFGRDAENVQHLVFAAFSDDGDHGGFGVEEGAHAGVFMGFHAAAAGHAEGGDLAGFEFELWDFAEKGRVFGIGEGEAALDKIDAQEVEFLGDLQLILKGEIESFALRAVAEGGVVDFDSA